MMRVKRFPTRLGRAAAFGSRRPMIAAAVLAATLGAGCSADVARFDFPGFGVSDRDGSSSSASIPRPTVPMRSGGS